jgi:hypothetical protein
MVIRTRGFATSTGVPDDEEELAYVYCVSDNGYCLSLARFPNDELVEVMVRDQVNHKTHEVEVILYRDKLVVNLSPTAAAALDGITEYVVPLDTPEADLAGLDAALAVIFSGGSRGRYNRRF